jgi:hypothetical protein
MLNTTSLGLQGGGIKELSNVPGLIGTSLESAGVSRELSNVIQRKLEETINEEKPITREEFIAANKTEMAAGLTKGTINESMDALLKFAEATDKIASVYAEKLAKVYDYFRIATETAAKIKDLEIEQQKFTQERLYATGMATTGVLSNAAAGAAFENRQAQLGFGGMNATAIGEQMALTRQQILGAENADMDAKTRTILMTEYNDRLRNGGIALKNLSERTDILTNAQAKLAETSKLLAAGFDSWSNMLTQSPWERQRTFQTQGRLNAFLQGGGNVETLSNMGPLGSEMLKFMTQNRGLIAGNSGFTYEQILQRQYRSSIQGGGLASRLVSRNVLGTEQGAITDINSQYNSRQQALQELSRQQTIFAQTYSDAADKQMRAAEAWMKIDMVAFTNVADRMFAASNNFKSLPDLIKLRGDISLNVNINGAEALKSMETSMKELVDSKMKDALIKYTQEQRGG